MAEFRVHGMRPPSRKEELTKEERSAIKRAEDYYNPKKEENVTYCEYIALSGNFIEVELPLSKAKKRYEQKLEALKEYPILEAMSFVGIKDKKGNWIAENNKLKKVL